MMRLVFIICILFISACANEKAIEEQKQKEKNLIEAAHFNTQLGLAYLKQGDKPRAKKKLLIALKQAPDSPTVNAAMAYFMEKTDSNKNAEIFYKKALQLAPNSGSQLNNYGTFLCRNGEYEKALDYFSRAVKDVSYDKTGSAYENAGLCALAIPDKTQALAYFKKALHNDNNRSQSLYEIVKIDLASNNPSEALEYLQKYPNISLKNRTLLKLAATTATKLGKLELAEEYNNRFTLITNKA